MKSIKLIIGEKLRKVSNTNVSLRIYTNFTSDINIRVGVIMMTVLRTRRWNW